MAGVWSLPHHHLACNLLLHLHTIATLQFVKLASSRYKSQLWLNNLKTSNSGFLSNFDIKGPSVEGVVVRKDRLWRELRTEYRRHWRNSRPSCGAALRDPSCGEKLIRSSNQYLGSGPSIDTSINRYQNYDIYLDHWLCSIFAFYACDLRCNGRFLKPRSSRNIPEQWRLNLMNIITELRACLLILNYTAAQIVCFSS